jgi:F-type H+-transporting ATPase subunit delta
VVRELGESLRLSTPVMNLLFVVIDHRRVSMLGSIAQAFEAALDERLGRVRAEIRSAMPLTGEQGEALLAQLRQTTGKQIRPEFITDEALLGGVTARIGSTIYDGSVRGRLETLRAQLSRG